MRWEFGFTCSLCLLHEADLALDPAGRRRLMTAEHRIARREDPSRAADYDNLLYACTYCNGARGRQPLVEGGSELLDPTAVAWAEHFHLANDHRLEPAYRVQEAQRTARVYGINDTTRRGIRQLRDELVTWCQFQVVEIPEALRILNDQLQAGNIDPIGWQRLSQLLRSNLRAAVELLSRFQAIPEDAPERCACKPLQLPAGLAKQVVQYP